MVNSDNDAFGFGAPDCVTAAPDMCEHVPPYACNSYDNLD